MEVAKALGGSFKLVSLVPKTVREMTQLIKEMQKNGDTNKSKRTSKLKEVGTILSAILVRVKITELCSVVPWSNTKITCSLQQN